MRRDTRAEGLLIVVTFIWGGTFAATKGALADISPLLMVGLRFILAGLLAIPVLLRSGDILSAGGSPPVGRDAADIGSAESPGEQPAEGSTAGPDAADIGPSVPRSSVFREKLALFTPATWRWGFIIALGMLLGYAGQTIGLKYTTVARSGFITYSFALLVPFLQFFLLGKRPGWGNLLGLFVVFWGFSFITDPSLEALRFGELSPLRMMHMGDDLAAGGLNRGDVFSLIGAVGYAFYVVFLDRATRVCHPGAVTILQMFFCGVLSLALSPFFETPFLIPTWRLAGALFYLVALGSILALALMNWFQRRLTPLRAVLIYSTEPVFAAIIGWIIFGAGMSIREIAGAVLILSGIFVSDLWNIAVSRRAGKLKKRLSAS